MFMSIDVCFLRTILNYLLLLTVTFNTGLHSSRIIPVQCTCLSMCLYSGGQETDTISLLCDMRCIQLTSCFVISSSSKLCIATSRTL